MILRKILIIALFLAICVPEAMALGSKKERMRAHVKKTKPSSLAFTFIPPKKWQCISEKEGLPAKVEAVYIGNGSNGFNPSINIATEETELNLEEYIHMAKIYHEKQPQTKCHLLGNCPGPMGNLELLQIEQMTSWGAVRFLQAAFIKNKKAYVITATCLEKDYGEYYPKFLQSLQTFNLNTPSGHEGKDQQ